MFSKDKTKLIRFPNKNGQTSYTITDGVTDIGLDAFMSCYELADVTIPGSVKSIASGAFQSIQAINVDETNSNYCSVDGVLFNKDKTEIICYPANKSGESSYTIPDGVTSIGDSAFSECDSLTEIVIPEGVTSIGDLAFSLCYGLTEVTIPRSVTSIGFDAFFACNSLTAFNVDKENAKYCSEDGVLFNKDKTELILYPQSNERTNYTIPTGVTDIDYNAFSSCGNLVKIEIPDSVTNIGGYAFMSCSNLSDITLPNSITSIKPGIFQACQKLTEITLPDSVTSIGFYAFAWSTNLTEITIPDSVTSIDESCFTNSEKLKDVYYAGSEADWAKIEWVKTEYIDYVEIKSVGKISLPEGATVHFGKTESDTSEPTTSDTTDTTVEIADEDTGIKTEVSTEDKELDGAKLEVDPADHLTLLDIIKRIVEKVVDTVENATEDVQKSLDEAAESVKNGKGFAYDMAFKKDGKEVQPGKPVTVNVPVPDNFKNDADKLNVYHLTDRGAVFVPSWVENGVIMFKTSSFSPYIITTDELKNAVVDENTDVTPGDSDKPTTGDPDNTDKPSTDQKPTGIALAIAPVVLAASAVVVISKKRK